MMVYKIDVIYQLELYQCIILYKEENLKGENEK